MNKTYYELFDFFKAKDQKPCLTYRGVFVLLNNFLEITKIY